MTVTDELNLEQCKFTNFSDLIIDDGIHVKKINMGRNQLTSLVDASDFLRHTINLDFNDNLIEDISENFLKQLIKLESLKLAENRIKMFPNIFEHLSNLKQLDLRNNYLGKFEAEWFNGLGKLEELTFSLENVTTFDYLALMNTVPALKTLNVRGTSEFECSFLRKMVTDLKAIGRVEVLKDPYGEFSEENEQGNYIYGIRCDKHLKDEDGFTYSYLKEKYYF